MRNEFRALLLNSILWIIKINYRVCRRQKAISKVPYVITENEHTYVVYYCWRCRCCRQCRSFTSVMKLTILMCVTLSLVEGLGRYISHENGAVDTSRRVIAGQNADPARFKFLVQLHSSDTLCGGSVISNYFILTSAHCMKSGCKQLKIFPSNWTPGATSRIEISDCYTHSKYNPQVNFYYDLTLIRTSNDMLEDERIQTIPLPPPGTRYPPGTRAVVVGWGKTENRHYPWRLMSGDVVVIDWETCNREYTNYVIPNKPKRAVCTRGPQGSPNTATCHGDSGGPVIINNILAAVITGTLLTPEFECAIGTPSLHLSVAEFLPWIYSFVEPGRDTSKYPVIEEPF